MRPLGRGGREPEALDSGDILVEVTEQELPGAPLVSLPPVNLLPATYARRAALAKARLFGFACVGAAVLMAVLAWLVSMQQATAAEERLAVATEQRTALQREAAKYVQVPVVFSAVESAQRQLEIAMGNEVRWSFFLNDLALTIPSGVSLDNLQVTSLAPGAEANEDGIGTMTVSAKAFTYNTVANWLDSMAKLSTLSDPYVGTISKGTLEGSPVVSYSSTANITDKALSERYLTKEVSR